MRLLVAQVEQAVARVVRVQAQLGAVLAEAAARAHHERLAAAVAELVLALRAREVHAAASEKTKILYRQSKPLLSK